jgi:Sodium/hydrogen exchanger family
MFLIDSLILGTGILLLLGIASSKLSNRLGVPVLVLFLVLGMLAGSDGIGGIEFENYRLAHGIGTLALAMILFDGGLSTPISSVRAVWKPAMLLATLGVLITSIVTGLAQSADRQLVRANILATTQELNVLVEGRFIRLRLVGQLYVLAADGRVPMPLFTPSPRSFSRSRHCSKSPINRRSRFWVYCKIYCNHGKDSS